MDCTLNNSFYEPYGQSIVCFKKDRNGDHLLLDEIKSEKILAACVADGVSSRPCDWMASELTCNKFIEFFSSDSINPVRDRIKKSICLTDACLNSVSDNCKGAASTMSLVVWEYEKENIYLANIGDSRIYIISDGKISCLTRDDKINRPMTVQTPSGIVTRDYWLVTKYIGMDFVEINVDDVKFIGIDCLLLASDGFYNARKSSFEYNMVELAQSENLESDFSRIISKFGILADDDMTALIIRKK